MVLVSIDRRLIKIRIYLFLFTKKIKESFVHGSYIFYIFFNFWGVYKFKELSKIFGRKNELIPYKIDKGVGSSSVPAHVCPVKMADKQTDKEMWL